MNIHPLDFNNNPLDLDIKCNYLIEDMINVTCANNTKYYTDEFIASYVYGNKDYKKYNHDNVPITYVIS